MVNMSLVVTESDENVCVSEDYGDWTQNCTYVLIP